MEGSHGRSGHNGRDIGASVTRSGQNARDIGAIATRSWQNARDMCKNGGSLLPDPPKSIFWTPSKKCVKYDEGCVDDVSFFGPGGGGRPVLRPYFCIGLERFA